MSEIANIQKAEIRKSQKSFLFYGPPGSGKTTLALKHPGKRKLVLDIDRKLHEMENAADLLQNVDVWTHDELINPSGIALTVVDPTRKDPKKGFDPSTRKPKGFDKQVDVTNDLLRMVEKKEFPYDCVIWDSGSASVDHLVAVILWTHGMGSMNQTLWGVFGTNFNNYLQGFLRLPCDRIVIFHERHVTKRNKDNEIIDEFIRPSCPGQMGIDMGRNFSEAYYFKGRDLTSSKYNLQTATDAFAYARTTKNLEFKQEIDPAKIYG